jgi:hypothetical protein
MPSEPQNTDDHAGDEPEPGSLVPLYGAPGIVPGIQAFRRGDFILYTIRGEPAKVEELMQQLDKQGVGEVIALIRHPALEAPREVDAGEAGEPTKADD